MSNTERLGWSSLIILLFVALILTSYGLYQESKKSDDLETIMIAVVGNMRSVKKLATYTHIDENGQLHKEEVHVSITGRVVVPTSTWKKIYNYRQQMNEKTEGVNKNARTTRTD